MQILKDALDDVILILAVLLVMGAMAQGKDAKGHQPDSRQVIPNPDFSAIEWPTCNYKVVLFKDGGGEVRWYGHKARTDKQTFDMELSVRPLTDDGIKQGTRDCQEFMEKQLTLNLKKLKEGR